MEKIIKARKIHKCDYCHGNIQKGNLYTLLSFKGPRFDEYGQEQIGIEYHKIKSHNYDCMPMIYQLNKSEFKKYMKECAMGNCKEFTSDIFGSSGVFCVVCGKHKVEK